MTWTYGGNPGTSTAAERRDAVRFLVGDTDTNDQQATDEEISFSLSQASNNVYSAAASIASSLMGKYARLVDVSFGEVKTSYSQRMANYKALRDKLRVDASRLGSLGLPEAGGISIADMESAREDSDRVRPYFREGQFDNPPRSTRDQDYYD